MQNRTSAASHRCRRSGYTLTDFCVVIAFGMLMLAVMPALSVRMNGDRDMVKCASNLRQISLAGIMYAAQSTRDNGKFPRTYFNPSREVTVYTGRDALNAFSLSSPEGPPHPKANDVTAAFYHLLKSTDLTADTFVCPASDATRLPSGPNAGIQDKSNFTGPEHLSYSYSTPYAKTVAIQNGWKFDSTLSPDYPFAADINPGDSDKGGPTKVAYTDPPDAMQWANSPNHYYAGQNVVYVDGHTEWQITPFAGSPIPNQRYRDNIYTSGGTASDGKGGVIMGMPQQMRQDFVLLPTIQQTTAGAKSTLAARTPGMGFRGTMLYVAIGVGVLAVVGVTLLIIVMKNQKKPRFVAPMPPMPMQPPPMPQQPRRGPPMA